MANITHVKRTCICSLWQHSYYTKSHRKYGGRKSKVCILDYAATGSAVPRSKGKCGRKQKSTPKDEAFLLINNKKNPGKSSFELQKNLAYFGVHVSSATLRC